MTSVMSVMAWVNHHHIMTRASRQHDRWLRICASIEADRERAREVHTHTLSLSLSHTHAHAHARALARSLVLSHTLSPTHTHQEVRRERLLQHEETIRAMEREREREKARIRQLEEAAAQLQCEVSEFVDVGGSWTSHIASVGWTSRIANVCKMDTRI